MYFQRLHRRGGLFGKGTDNRIFLKLHIYLYCVQQLNIRYMYLFFRQMLMYF